MNILVSIPQGDLFDSFIYKNTVERMRKMGNVVLNESNAHFTHEELCEKIKGMDIVITGWGSPCIDADVLQYADSLKYVAHTGGSVANYVCEEVYKKGITVISGNEMYAESVAEGVIAYILSSLRMIPRFSHRLSYDKVWENQDLGRNYAKGLLDRTVGIVSYGTISKYIIPMLQPFHVKIKLYSRKTMPQEFLEKYNVEQVSLEEVFSTSDIITMQTAKNPQTIGMINKKHLSLIKDGALFVNTSRGPIVDEDDLIAEIEKDRIYVMLDVYNKEPLPQDSPLLGREKVLLMPHMAGPTIDRRDAITNALLTDIENHMAGKPLTLEIPWELAREMTQN